MLGGLGLFNSYKLEIRYEIISTLVILYFALAFAAEVLVSTKNKITDSTKEITLLKNDDESEIKKTYEFVGPLKSLSDDEMEEDEFPYDDDFEPEED
jgi:hypothetical protein